MEAQKVLELLHSAAIRVLKDDN